MSSVSNKAELIQIIKDWISVDNDIRNINNGMFSGPKPTDGRYNVSEQAADLLNRSKNKGKN